MCVVLLTNLKDLRHVGLWSLSGAFYNIKKHVEKNSFFVYYPNYSFLSTRFLGCVLWLCCQQNIVGLFNDFLQNTIVSG